MHIIELVGIDYVGLGSDFDGMEKEFYPKDIKNVNDMKIIIEKLNKEGLNDKQIEQITGENFFRYIKQKI